ncbi:MAG: hypothetical protein ACKO1U_10995 [Bacteroidota bacterium]
MKYILLPALLVAVTLASSGQQPKSTPAAFTVTPELLAAKDDTLITNDPVLPGRTYWVIVDPNKMVKQQGPMQDGKKDGTWREYGGMNHALMKVAEYRSGKLNGVSTALNVSGMVTADETYRNDSLNGPRMLFTQSGRVRLMENYKSGQLDGTRISYYDDGKLQESGSYVMGKRDGLTKWFAQNGNVSLEYTYKLGDLNGLAKQYDEKGLIREEGNYVNNNEDGEWKVYEGGVMIKKVIYKDGNKVKEIEVRK